VIEAFQAKRVIRRVCAVTSVTVVGVAACSVDYHADDERFRKLHCSEVPEQCDAAMPDVRSQRGADASTDRSIDAALADAPAGSPETSDPVDAACTPESPDPATAIFVSSAAGASAGDCGSPQKPCSTIAQGLARARSTSRGLVFLDSGEYAEQVTLVAGVTLRGGWNNLAGTWTRQCQATRSASAVIASPSNVGVQFQQSGTAGLEALTVRTKPSAAASETSYGVLVRGADTNLILDEVLVVAAEGGDGATGTAGTPRTQATGTCTPSDGAPGAGEGRAGDGAPAGSFSAEGYVRSDGESGGVGTPGNPGVVASASCVRCVSCLNEPPCLPSPDGQECATPGGSGCGGLGGRPGAGGHGGGSSVALFVWQATVVTRGGKLEAGSGGTGGPGGDPGAGGEGADGVLGSAGTACPTSCGTLSCVPTLPRGAKATAGGKGGSGSAGGRGGAGAGGHSYSVVSGGGATVNVGGSTALVHGDAGTSSGNGAAGVAGDVLRLP
jgi:hypothetical protein